MNETNLKEIPPELYQPPPVSCPACGYIAKAQRYNKDGTATYRCNFTEEHGVYCFKKVPFMEYFEESDFVYKGPIPDDIKKKIALADSAAKIKKQLKNMAPHPHTKVPKTKPTVFKKITMASLTEDAWSLCNYEPSDLLKCKKENLIALGMYFISAQLNVGKPSRLVVRVAASNGKPCRTVSDDDEFPLTHNDQHIGEVMFLGSKGLVKELGYYQLNLTATIPINKDNKIVVRIGEHGELILKYVGQYDIGEPSAAGFRDGISVVYDIALR